MDEKFQSTGTQNIVHIKFTIFQCIVHYREIGSRRYYSDLIIDVKLCIQEIYRAENVAWNNTCALK